MTFMELARNRYSERYFSSRPVEEEKLAQIESYDASPEVEEFTINGTPMWLGHELRQQIRTSADAYTAMGIDTMTKIFNGVEYTFPMNAVMAMTRRKDVEDYDYTTGYPEKLSFGNEE